MERVIYQLDSQSEQIILFGLKHEQDSQMPWIVILPGLDDSVLYYKNLFDHLKKELPNYNLLALDLKGQGETLKQNKKIRQMKVSIDHQAKLVQKVLRELNIRNFFIIGLSYAGAVSMRLGNLEKNVLGIGLIAPYVSHFKTYKKGLTGLYYQIIEKHPAKKLIALTGLPFYFSTAKYENRLNKNTLWDHHKLSALSKLTLGVLDFDTEEEIRKINRMEKGIHFLCGFDDQVIPIAAHKDLYKKISNEVEKTFSLEEGVGHRIFEEHPEVASHWIAKIVS